MMPTVLITGAAGNIGSKLRAHLSRARPELRLLLVDRDPGGDPEVRQFDLTEPACRLVPLLEGVDSIIHLAANRDPAAGWKQLNGPNVDAVLNLYLAAADAAVRRIVLASSVWAARALDTGAGPIGPLDPDPGDNPYGATKLFAERVGRAFAEARGISTVALRIGGCRPGPNPPPGRFRSWDQRVWISDADVCQGIERALDLPGGGFQLFNLVSNLPSRSWDLAATQRSLGVCQDPPLPVERESLAVRALRLFSRISKRAA
jgi:NAD+ dependent glucose-6-phosphate dehydrogenase/L-arabinose 1-dehydrogenase [NAD(P)+]